MEYVIAYFIIGLVLTGFAMREYIKEGNDVNLGQIFIALMVSVVWPFVVFFAACNIVVVKGIDRE